MTPYHKNFIPKKKVDELIEKHLLFQDMTIENSMTTSGMASDWPYGRGIWISEDETRFIWIGEEDHLKIITIVKGNDLGALIANFSELLYKI